MFKDQGYYLGLDLPEVAARIPKDRPARLRSDELADVIIGILHQCDAEPITGEYLRSLLGDPDTTCQRPDGEVWEYDWIGWHGPNQYFSATPFVLRAGRVVGVERHGKVLGARWLAPKHPLRQMPAAIAVPGVPLL
jgi:hypothetical protein